MITVEDNTITTLKVTLDNGDNHIIPKGVSDIIFSADQVGIIVNNKVLFYDDFNNISPVSISAQALVNAITAFIGLFATTDQVLNKDSEVQVVRNVSANRMDRARGFIGDEASVNLNGANTVVGASFATLWEGGGIYVFPEAAEKLRVKSGGNAADAAAGANARTLTVFGLDANFSSISEDITLAGASASSSTSASFIRVNFVLVKTTGTYGAGNAGDIIIENADTNTVLSIIKTGESRSNQFVFTVPLGQTSFITQLFLEASDSNTAEMLMLQRGSADVVAAPFTPKIMARKIVDFSGVFGLTDDAPRQLSEKTDFWIDVKRVSGGGNAQTAAFGSLISVTNPS